MSKAVEFQRNETGVESTQRELLNKTLQDNANCAYGRFHQFASIDGALEYAALPYMTFDNVTGVENYWASSENFSSGRLIARFITSGSTSAPKKIPVTTNLVREKAAAFAVFWDSVYAAHPALKTGNFIANFGDTGVSHRSPEGILEVAETTFWNQRMQGFQTASRWPLGKHLSVIESADQRYYAAVRLALQGPLHCMMSLNPSTLLRFCRVLEEHQDDLSRGLADGVWGLPVLDANAGLPGELSAAIRRDSNKANIVDALPAGSEGFFQLKGIWPELELIICWQSDLVEPFLRLLRRYAEGINFRDYITQSSECIMAIPVSDNHSGGLLAYTSHYFEFISEEDTEKPHPDAVPAWELEAGRKYELVVTTGGGLYRYRTSDCILVDGFNGGIPHLRFQYRLGRTSSITGEKLTELQVLAALESQQDDTAIDLSRVTVFPHTGEQPRYAVLVPAGLFPDGWGRTEFKTWARSFDRALGQTNGEYKDKRASLRLGEPTVVSVSDTDYETLQDSFRASHIGDEQFKPGVLRKDHDLDATLSSARDLCAD
jgi:hypothetical protein